MPFKVYFIVIYKSKQMLQTYNLVFSQSKFYRGKFDLYFMVYLIDFLN